MPSPPHPPFPALYLSIYICTPSASHPPHPTPHHTTPRHLPHHRRCPLQAHLYAYTPPIRRAVQVLNLESSRDSLEELSVILHQHEEWAEDFVEVGGVEALSELLGSLEQKTIKEPEDFEMMGQVLIIHTHAINIMSVSFSRRYRPLPRAAVRCCAACGC